MLLAGLREGALVAGGDPNALDVVSKLFVAVDEDLDELGPRLRHLIAGYATVPACNALLSRQGFQVEAGAMMDAWADGPRADAAAAVSDELLRALIVVGTAEECRAQLAAYVAAGVRTLLTAPISAASGTARRAQIEHTIEAVAPGGVDTEADVGLY